MVWAYDADHIVNTCNDFENKLIKLLWEKRYMFAPATVPSQAPSTTASDVNLNEKVHGREAVDQKEVDFPGGKAEKKRKKRGCKWPSFRYFVSKQEDVEKTADGASERPMRMLAPFYAGLSVAMSICRSFLLMMTRRAISDASATSLHW